MTTQMLIRDILQLDLVRKNVVITGNPASGKTHLANLMKKAYPYHKFISTDEFMEYGFEDALYELMRAIKEIGNYVIIEGVLGYRLLRKGVERDEFYPEMVINMDTPEEEIEKVYAERGQSEKFIKVKSMIKGNKTVYDLYLGMDNPHKPIIINAVRNLKAEIYKTDEQVSVSKEAGSYIANNDKIKKGKKK